MKKRKHAWNSSHLGRINVLFIVVDDFFKSMILEQYDMRNRRFHLSFVGI